MINELDDINLGELNEKFRYAKPFQHVIIDNFLKQNIFNNLSLEMSEYYDVNEKKGKRWNSQAESGKWGSTGLQLPSGLKALDEYLKSPDLIKILQKISGFEDLKVTANINGIGFSFFHAMKPGAYLGPHTDHTRDLNNGPYHVLNIIIYMSNNWDANWGGGTTIFDGNQNLGTDVEYKPNRALIFMHSPFSVHGTQRISELAKNQRFSIYYDYYTSKPEPYKHLNITKIKLLNSPHFFYLPTIWDYIKPKNIRYTKMHLAHFKQHILSLFK